VTDKDAGVDGRFRVEADDWLPVEVLRGVGDQAVLANHRDEVVRCEREVPEIRAFDGAASPVGGDGRGHGPQGLLDRGVPVVDLADIAASVVRIQWLSSSSLGTAKS